MAASCAPAAQSWRLNLKKRVTAPWKPRPPPPEKQRDRIDVTTATHAQHNYFERFSEFERLAVGRDLPWLRDLRREAFACFCKIGFPTTHDEDWRFTDVSAIANTAFRLLRNAQSGVSLQQLNPWRVEGA